MSNDLAPDSYGRDGEASNAQSPQKTDRLKSAARRQELFDLVVCLGLILSTLAVYAQVGGFDFVNYDDDKYVYENAHVRDGLTLGGAKWAFTAVVAGNWMPVTLLSHILDAQLFEMGSGMHHLVSVLFHMLSAVLLYVLLRRSTGAQGLSAFVAFAFALHPLHVESVAWISERKDVLSVFFWFLALYGYVRYTERPSPARYLAMAAAFCLGLMSKPMIVTFPFTLLLLDIWPLRRAQWPKTVIEKLPLIGLCAAASAVTYFAQESAGAITAIPLPARIENVFVSYVTYIVQTFWPTRLAAFYPYPLTIPAWEAGAAFAVVVALSTLVLSVWRTRPYLMVGWFWFLGTLFPVIGLVQVGIQAHADRYMYIPMVGLLVMLAWGAGDIGRKWPRTKPAIAGGAAVSCVAWMALAWKQTAYWQNSETLFQHAIEVTQDNWLAEIDLGIYLNSVRRGADAIPHFENALRIKPDDAHVHDSIGTSLASLGDCAAAIPHFEAAIRARPDLANASYNLGYCMATSGDDASAIPYLEAAVRAQPDFAKAHVRLGMSLSNVGRKKEAITHLEAAQRIHPDPAISKILAGLREGQKQ